MLFDSNPITTTFWCFVFHILTAAQSDMSSYLDLYDCLIKLKLSDLPRYITDNVANS